MTADVVHPLTSSLLGRRQEQTDVLTMHVQNNGRETQNPIIVPNATSSISVKQECMACICACMHAKLLRMLTVVYVTTEGTVSRPWRSGSSLTVPSTQTEMAEFVVPRSIPTGKLKTVRHCLTAGHDDLLLQAP